MVKSRKIKINSTIKRRHLKQKAGNCGCKKSGFFTGGNSSNLPYPLNTHETDLRGVSTRIMPNMTGGKRKRKGKGKGKRKTIKINKKMKGGNIVMSGISLQGVSKGGNILSGDPLPSDDIYNESTNTINV